MNKFGHVRVTAAVPKVVVANVNENVEEHIRILEQNTDSDIIVFPELSLTGYTCGDLFGQKVLIDQAAIGLKKLARYARDTVVIVGLPIFHPQTGSLYNCAAVLQNFRIEGIVPKTYLPNYREFYEKRWFAEGISGSTIMLGQSNSCYPEEIPFGTDLLFQHYAGWKFGVEICEDIWAPIPPSSFQALGGASILFNLSASNETVGKSQFRRDFIKAQTGKLIAGYVYCSSGPTESTSDLVFGGHCLIAENGHLLAESKRFIRNSHVISADIDVESLRHERAAQPGTFGESVKKFKPIFRTQHVYSAERDDTKGLLRPISATPFVPSDPATLTERCAEIFGIQCCGLAKRIESLSKFKCYIGVSGGLDSTLALLVAVKTYDMLCIDRKNIHGITMPGFGTTDRTKDNAVNLMAALGTSQETIDIRKTAVEAFESLNHIPFGRSEFLDFGLDQKVGAKQFLKHDLAQFQVALEQLPAGCDDLVFENVQARLRTFYLMSRGFVVGTGDMSEIALGWCTYNGDHMSMYNPNCSIPKTLIKFLVNYVAQNELDGLVKTGGDKTELAAILSSVVDTVISPELLPAKEGEIVQSSEDKLGPYMLHDFFLYYFQKSGFSPKKIMFLAAHAFKDAYSVETIKKHLNTFIRRFFQNQFKRNCVPDGPKVGSVSLSPRGDWRMPSDASARLWLDDIADNIPELGVS